MQLYGDGTAELLHELKSGTVYPVAIQQDGASVSWTVSASDTATVGAGRAELRWYVGDTLAKSAKFRTSVSSALADSTTETPPEPQQSWVDKVLQAAQEIKDGAISDEKLAAAIAAYLEEHPIDAGLDEAALAAYLVENGYLTNADLADAIAQALAEAKASGQFDGDPGRDGADGSPGADGADGVGIQSVVQTTTSTEDGGTNIVTVTKTDGTTSTFQVKNGSKGSDGAPGKDGTDGAPGADGKDGADGQPGADGVTPNIQIGTVETLTAGNDATASITGTPENPLLNLGIPKGADGTGESITDEQAAQIEQNTADITDLKESLDNKLSKSPANWETWTADEQAAARERMGIPGDYELIEEIVCDGEVSLYNREMEPDGTPYDFHSIYAELEIQPQNVYSTVFFRAYDAAGAAVLYDGISATQKAYTTYGFAGCYAHSGFYRGWTVATNIAESNSGGAANMRINKPKNIVSPIKKILISRNNGVFFDGDKIRIYGVRA